MMVKRKVTRASMVPSSSYPVGEEAKARFRHHSLMEDYLELANETEAKRKSLLKAKQKKLQLLAEVKFLRRKLKSFVENPSLKTPYRVKKKSCETAFPTIHNAQLPHPIRYGVTEAAVPSTVAVFDLNQAVLPNDEEMEEREPLRMDRLKRFAMEGASMANDLRLSICRGVGNGANRVGRRKLSWQDQLPLKV